MPVDWRNFLSFPQERASGATRPAPAARGPGQLGRACRALTLAALLLPAWASIFSGHASAQTSVADSPQAGIILRTQADVTLLPAGHTREVRILSNIVEVRVSPVEALLLTPGGSRDGVPGASVQMPHVLTNTGNIVSGYAFDLNVVAGSFAPQAPTSCMTATTTASRTTAMRASRCKAPRSRWNRARPPACWRSPPCPTMRRTDRYCWPLGQISGAQRAHKQE
ncbi:hypothetical protein WJ968_16635 [Achromobacter xylosoxidans]